MAGFKSKKIFCMDMSRLSGKPCQAKGFPTNSFNKHGFQIYKCRFHGAQSILESRGKQGNESQD